MSTIGHNSASGRFRKLWMDFLFSHPDRDPYKIAFGFVLCRYMGPDGSEIHLGAAQVAELTKMTDRHERRVKRWFEKVGLVRVLQPASRWSRAIIEPIVPDEFSQPSTDCESTDSPDYESVDSGYGKNQRTVSPNHRTVSPPSKYSGNISGTNPPTPQGGPTAEAAADEPKKLTVDQWRDDAEFMEFLTAYDAMVKRLGLKLEDRGPPKPAYKYWRGLKTKRQKTMAMFSLPAFEKMLRERCKEKGKVYLPYVRTYLSEERWTLVEPWWLRADSERFLEPMIERKKPNGHWPTEFGPPPGNPLSPWNDAWEKYDLGRFHTRGGKA